METMQMWEMSGNQREAVYVEGDYEWTEWGDYSHYHPHYWAKHESAVSYIDSIVDRDCQENEGMIIRRDACPGDGWYYVEWQANYDGIIRQYILQINGYPEYVVMD